MPLPTERIAEAVFATQLKAAVNDYPFTKTRFFQLLSSGRCPPKVLCRYGLATWQGATLFCSCLAGLIEIAPSFKARSLLMDNLLEEEGIHLEAGRGLVVQPQARHIELAHRFAVACGVGDSEMGDNLHPLQPGLMLIQQGRWLEAVAYLLVGQELAFSAASQQLLNGFSALGLPKKSLAFFAVHNEADERHGQQALGLIVEHARTFEQQKTALEAARAGARNWFERHGGDANRLSVR